MAQRALAKFRINYGLYAGDPILNELVEDLLHVSQEFRLWWPRHMIQSSHSGVKHLEHPLCGRLVLDHHSFQVYETPTLRVVVYTPLAEENTPQKLEQLLGLRSHTTMSHTPRGES